MTKTRDKIVQAVSDFVFRFASEAYRERVEFTFVLGLDELERRKDANKNRALIGNTNYEETR